MSENSKSSPSFGKIMLASGVGTLIVLILVGIFKLMMFMGIIGSVSKSSEPVISKQAFLKIDLTKSINERTPADLDAMFDNGSSIGFNDLLRSINNASDDDNITGIYLYMGSAYPMSWGMSEELRQALKNFMNSGKPVLAYADGYSQQAYFLASVADSIYMNPSGLLQFSGIAAEALFFKDLLDRMDVHMTLVRPKSNSFKSAGETYTMNHMSDANRTQIRQYIASIWDYAVEQIGESRDISAEELNTMADNLSACLPDDALNARLVDRLCFENDIKNTMKEAYNSTATVNAADYAKSIKRDFSASNRIAVIYAQGDVVDGSGFNTAVYSDKITKALVDAANDDNIKAIVLRVNSPGGQVTASEVMTNAVMRAKQKKPVIVSMSDLAASAGYEISCNANYIVAEPTTITGSIGVFATIPELGTTLKKHVGITSDTAMTNANATALSVMRPMSPRTMELMQRNVEEFYTVFVNRVAKGRNLRPAFVDSIARGRVWTGRDALKLGLVDALGGLDDAIAIAADSAQLTDYAVIDYPANESLLNDLLNRKNGSSGTAQYNTQPFLFPSNGLWLPTNLINKTLRQICETRGLQARLDFFILEDF
jgi:protease-4